MNLTKNISIFSITVKQKKKKYKIHYFVKFDNPIIKIHLLK